MRRGVRPHTPKRPNVTAHLPGRAQRFSLSGKCLPTTAELSHNDAEPCPDCAEERVDLLTAEQRPESIIGRARGAAHSCFCTNAPSAEPSPRSPTHRPA